nr:RNA-directed DNA polymerase, eukaryota [Tanacetum cinerariifolium]
MCLQETKLESLELFNIKRCWGNFNFDHVYSPSVGNSGGILCVWDPRVFCKDNSTVSDYFVMVRGEWIQNGKMILIISIYAPQELSEKKMIWDYLSLVIGNWQGDVIIMRDFNEVRKQKERYGSVFNVHGADAFNLFISNVGLEEIHLGGCSFTWCHKTASKMSKLDRFPISEGIVSAYPNISAITLDQYLFDHRPILMRESKFDYGPTPFLFFHYWFDIEGFNEFVKNTWKDAQVTDHNAMGKFMKKLKFLKGKIREWTKVKKDIDKLESMEVAQKVKIKWGIEGDENSKYYHGTLYKQRSQLAIKGVLIDGTWTESPNLVKDEFFSHLQNRFGHPYSSRIQLEMEFPIQLSSKQKDDMECNITRKEIKRAAWDCGTDKSPGPYGFSFGFYKRFWCAIENDVVEAVNTFFQNAAFPKGGNASFIALIPKTHNANMVKDFWPITLIVIIYKIIAKILANHLMSVLGDIMNEVQSAFVDNRQILDGSFILNEIASGLHINKNKSKLMGLAVDNDKVVQAAEKIGCASIKTFFGSLPIYHISIYKVPKKVLNRLEFIRCNFFNGIDPLSKKPIWIKWNKVLAPKDKCGLGILSFYALNRALLFKWVCRFHTQCSSLWGKVIKGIHSVDDKIADFCSFETGLREFEFLFSQGPKRRWSWSLEGSGEFSVASIRRVIDDKLLPLVSSKTRWVNMVPIKVNIHAWKKHTPNSIPTTSSTGANNSDHLPVSITTTDRSSLKGQRI